MHVELTETQRQPREAVHAFAAPRREPIAAAIDPSSRFPRVRPRPMELA